MNRRFLIPAVLALAAAVMSGCSDSTEPGTTATLILQFVAQVDGAPLTLDTQTYTNAAGNNYTVSNLEYVVSEFFLEEEVAPALARDHGDGFTADVQHYRTEADAATQTLTLENVPAGDYSHLHFHFGIPGSENTVGAFPALDAANMTWPDLLGGGYHYMRHEGSYTPTGGGTANFTTHTGPTSGQDYSVEVELELEAAGLLRHGFEIAADQTVTVQIIMNVNRLYTTPTNYDFNDHTAIMGDAAAQVLLQGNAHDVWSLGSVTVE